MIRSLDDWRRAIGPLVPPEAIPTRPELGRLYPWRAVTLHALSREHARRVDGARRLLAQAQETGASWRLGWSAGKDSTALAALAAEAGWHVQAVSVKDDLDYPGETEYVQGLALRLGLEVAILQPTVSLLEYLRQMGASLTEDLHSRRADLSREHFYGLLDSYRAQEGYDGVLLGLRAGESSHRRRNRCFNGPLYRRRDGLAVCTPLADWTSLDVHAYLAARDVPILPVYLCIDDAREALEVRKSWYVAGGWAAQYGHYAWLRRWWPELYARAAGVHWGVEAVS